MEVIVEVEDIRRDGKTLSINPFQERFATQRLPVKESLLEISNNLWTMIIEISRLDLNVIETDLRRLFTPFGEISSIEIVRDRINNRSKGKAVINMPVKKQAELAALSLNGTLMSGKSIIVTLDPSSGEDDRNKSLV